MPWRLHPSLTYVARLCEVVCEHGSLTRWSHLCDMNLGMTTTQTGVIVVTSPTQKPQICGCVDPRLCAEGNFMMCWTLCCGHAISFYYHGRHYYYFLPADVDKWGPRCTSTKNLWACSICQFARCYQPCRGKQPVERNVSDGHPSPTAAL